MVKDIHVYGSSNKDMSSAAPNDGQWPGADDIDNEWVYIKDEALGLTGSFEHAVSFASQYSAGQDNFMTEWHEMRRDPRKNSKVDFGKVIIWQVSINPSLVYERNDRVAGAPAGGNMAGFAHVLLVGTNEYFPLIPRKWLVDASHGETVDTEDVIVQCIRDATNQAQLRVESYDSSTNRWSLGAFLPTVYLTTI